MLDKSSVSTDNLSLTSAIQTIQNLNKRIKVLEDKAGIVNEYTYDEDYSKYYNAESSVDNLSLTTTIKVIQDIYLRLEELNKKTGSKIFIDDKFTENVMFLSNPQEQINLINKQLITLNDEISTKIDKYLVSSEAHRFKFNQLFNPDNSTLPSANGLTVTNIYGGHNVIGTTDHQFYHKMYDISTINGHWYYFAPNFSNTKSVYILGHIDGTAFSTNSGKAFEGGDKFDIYIQIEKNKTMDFDVQPILIDLTEMFGAGNEPNSVDELYKYIVKGQYYPYVDIPTKEEVNSLSMCPSDTFINNFVNLDKDGIVNINETITFPTNGTYFCELVNTQSSTSQTVEYRRNTLPMLRNDVGKNQRINFAINGVKNDTLTIKINKRGVSIIVTANYFVPTKEI